MWTVRNQDTKTEFKNNTELKTPKLSLTIKETKIKAQYGRPRRKWKQLRQTSTSEDNHLNEAEQEVKLNVIPK